MAPLVCLTPCATPEEPEADWPPLACQALPPSYFQSFGAAAIRYLVKLSVVPDSSERWYGWIWRSGSFAPGFSFAMAASFQFLILPSKIFARVGASRTRFSTPERLYATAIGPATIGRSMPWPPVQTFLEAVTSSGFSAESEPAKATVPCVNAVMPAPEPEPL
jgi:hypothetical protein